MSDTMFSVSKHVDQLREVQKKEYEAHDWGKYDFFGSEDAAKHFILTRAAQAVQAAENDLEKAKARHRKCVRKYGSSLKPKGSLGLSASGNGD
jgi:hypothetical protein